jgi:CBS domain-containing protein
VASQNESAFLIVSDAPEEGFLSSFRADEILTPVPYVCPECRRTLVYAEEQYSRAGDGSRSGQTLVLSGPHNTVVNVSDILSEDVVTVYLEDDLLEVADVLRDEKVGSAVVLGADGGVVGIVTDRDLVVFGRHFADELERTTVNEILSMNVVSVAPDTGIQELTKRMREERVRRAPVVADGELRGIVTLDDVVVHLAGELESPELGNLAAVIESESPP